MTFYSVSQIQVEEENQSTSQRAKQGVKHTHAQVERMGVSKGHISEGNV